MVLFCGSPLGVLRIVLFKLRMFGVMVVFYFISLHYGHSLQMVSLPLGKINKKFLNMCFYFLNQSLYVWSTNNLADCGWIMTVEVMWCVIHSESGCSRSSRSRPESAYLVGLVWSIVLQKNNFLVYWLLYMAFGCYHFISLSFRLVGRQILILLPLNRARLLMNLFPVLMLNLANQL